MMKWLAFLLVMAPCVAAAQERESAAMRSLALALQQMATSTEQYITDVNQRLAVKDARIAELIKLCGEPCKPLAEAKQEK